MGRFQQFLLREAKMVFAELIPEIVAQLELECSFDYWDSSGQLVIYMKPLGLVTIKPKISASGKEIKSIVVQAKKNLGLGGWSRKTVEINITGNLSKIDLVDSVVGNTIDLAKNLEVL